MDECDSADAYTEKFLQKRIAEESKEIPRGIAGDCCECEQPSPRLINRKCARCRDDEDKLIARR